MLNEAALPQDDDDLDLVDEDVDGFDELVPGLPSLLLGLVRRKPYPINIYNLDGRKESGLAGTLFPDGTFLPLPARSLPRRGEHFDEGLKTKLPHTIEWDGNVVGCVEVNADPDEPFMRRLCDGSILGPWPIHPPKPDRLVSVEAARRAAEESEANDRQNASVM